MRHSCCCSYGCYCVETLHHLILILWDKTSPSVLRLLFKRYFIRTMVKKKLLIQMDVIFLGILLQGHWQPNDTWTPAKVIPENKGSLRRRQERWLCQVLPCISATAVLVQIDTCIIYSQPFPTTCKLCLLGKGQKWGNMRHLGGQFSSLRLYAAPHRLAVFQPLFYSSVKQLSLLKQVGWL